MQYSEQVIVKRWIPILKEYERTKAKVNPRLFKFIKDLCEAHQGKWGQATFSQILFFRENFLSAVSLVKV